ncbi:phosphonate ABC transporter, permease protein PhnE [bacterium]|nr:phosphonate ABC transporter, permease protein PhnE [bacterium]
MRKHLPLLTFLGLFIWASLGTGVSLPKFVEGLGDMGRFVKEMFPADFSEVSAVWPDFVLTLRMAWVSTLVGALLAYPFALLAAGTTTTWKSINGLFRLLLNGVRTVPDLLLASLAVALFGANPSAGAVALTLFSMGIIGKLLFETLESIDQGPLEAMTALGAPWIARLRYGALPLALPQFLTYCLYVFEINIRVAAIVGLVGAGGIGVWMNINFDLGQYQKVAALLVTLFLVVTVIDAVSTRIRKALAQA